jgi:hypothetical protein
MMKLANHHFLQVRGKYVGLRVDARLGEKLSKIVRFIFEAARFGTLHRSHLAILRHETCCEFWVQLETQIPRVASLAKAVEEKWSKLHSPGRWRARRVRR